MMQSNLLGAATAQAIYLLCCGVFVTRLVGRSQAEHWLGLAMVAMVLPLGYLLWTAGRLGRPPLYCIQVGLMVAYLLVELALDYVLKVEFRQVRWAAIAYVMLFFGALGGMIGVASFAGRPWTISSVALFLLTVALAFYQRAKTGM